LKTYLPTGVHDDYDGQWLFINDKANARVAVIDLRDFETKQIIKNPVALNDHGGAMVTPNTDYVIEGGQYAAPLGWEYAAIEDYNDEYRGMVTFWKFNRDTGRLDPDASFAIELPPYWQDLCDAGKLASDGWVLCNSFNTERATGVALFLWLLFVFVGDLGLMGTALAFKLPIETLFHLALVNPLQVFKMASLGGINATLDVFGPAGIYAMQTYRDNLTWLFLGALLAWIVVPLFIAYFVLARRGDV
jgi:hypothetical protein